MGKQMTGILKSKATKLFAMFPTEFADDYEVNKKKLDSTGLFEYSKTDRNMVAGQITRLVRKEQKKDD